MDQQRIVEGSKTCHPGASLVVQMMKNPPAIQGTWIQSLGWEDPLEKGTAAHSSILVWRIHGQRSLADYSPWGLKESYMIERLSQTTCLSVLGIISNWKESRPKKLRNFDLPTNCLKEFA